MVSEIAIVPDRELMKPILMVSPDVSTQEAAVLLAVPSAEVASTARVHDARAKAIAVTAVTVNACLTIGRDMNTSEVKVSIAL